MHESAETRTTPERSDACSRGLSYLLPRVGAVALDVSSPPGKGKRTGLRQKRGSFVLGYELICRSHAVLGAQRKGWTSRRLGEPGVYLTWRRVSGFSRGVVVPEPTPVTEVPGPSLPPLQRTANQYREF